jgi:hypothetical protein
MAQAIQQEVYQEEFVIHSMGPSAHALGIAMTYIRAGCSYKDPVHFGFIRGDGESSYLPVTLTLLQDVGNKIECEEWEFEGILALNNLYARKISESIWERAKVKGTYNSRTRSGKLQVLAHAQPKPVVEVLTWEEFLVRLEGRKGKAVFEARDRVSGVPTRGMYLSHEWTPLQSLLTIRGGAFHHLRTCWEAVEGREFGVSTRPHDPLPLALADGRLTFTTLHGGGTHPQDCVVYMPGDNVTYTHG